MDKFNEFINSRVTCGYVILYILSQINYLFEKGGSINQINLGF